VARRLRQEDLSFLTHAPIRQVHRGQVALPVDRVFAGLADHPESWPDWLSPARGCHYEGAPPHGLGTIRHLSLCGGIRARERILAWDVNERLAYRVEEVNAPGVRAFLEEWTLAPVARDRTQLQWLLAVDCTRPLALLLQASRRPLDHIFREGTRRLAASSR
jgi:Polyketide cyclase / dehydrase and lipid transport